jgi:hypothetical protein
MSVKIRRYGGNGIEQPEVTDIAFENREVTFNNMTFHYGMNETRNFADDGVGLGFVNTTENIVEDAIPFGDSRA